MNRYQSAQHWSNHGQSPPVQAPVRAHRSSPPRLNLALVFYLLQQRPLVFWSGVWVILLLIAGIAMTGLVSPILSKRQQQPLPNVVQSSPPSPVPELPQSNANQGNVPIWTFGAIALGCAGGSLMISHRLRQPQPPRKSLKRSPVRAKPAPPALPSASSPGFPQQGTRRFLPQALKSPQPQAAFPAEPEPVVTVMPAEHHHPLDWNEESLADRMDIRHRGKFSRWS